VDVVNSPADLAAEHAAAQLLQCRIETFDVPDGGLHARGCTGRDDLPRLVRACCKRLLDQQRHAGAGQLLDRGDVQLGRNRDDGKGRSRRCQQCGDRLEYEAGLVHGPEAVTVRIDGPGKRDPLELCSSRA
jgi:hypothetical protein